VSVLDARLATRDDGVAIDTFHVADALGSGGVGKARWPDIRRDLQGILAGQVDLEGRLADKARHYPSPAAEGGSVLIQETGGATIVEVRCQDRIGLLHDLAAAIAESGFDVTLAKVDTRVDRVIDVFYVRPVEAIPGASVEQLRVALETTVGADG
jgi:[protein-PII] uridylyltransferase